MRVESPRLRRWPVAPAAVLLTMFLANSAWSANLLEVYRLARNNDPAFAAARHTLEAARQKIPEARAGLLPSVNMVGNDSHTNASTTFDPAPTMDRNVRTWTWTLQLVQPLMRMQNLFAYQESKHVVEQATAQFAQAEQELILRVAQAYFGVVSAQESIAAIEAQVKAMEEQLAQATHGYQAGTHAVTDVYEARSRRDLATSWQASAPTWKKQPAPCRTLWRRSGPRWRFPNRNPAISKPGRIRHRKTTRPFGHKELRWPWQRPESAGTGQSTYPRWT